MKSSELRIGNWVNISISSGLEQQVIDCMCDSVNTKYHEAITLDWVEPIHLTEEWLVRFGFDVSYNPKHYIKNYTKIDDGGEMCVFIKYESDFFWFGLQDYSLDIVAVNKIQYVHQLQNLYFALTGEELTTS